MPGLGLRLQGGFFWPASDEVGATAILAHAERHFPAILQFVPGRSLAIQAGGNVGVYPKRLAEHFAEVLTYEPEAENFVCLARNLAEIANVFANNVALGAVSRGNVGLRKHPNNAGAHRIEGNGAIRMIRIDDLELSACDLVWLDIEGYEKEALIGAEATLKRFRPVVIVEDMGLAEDGEGAARNWLRDRGYRQAGKIMHDYVMIA